MTKLIRFRCFGGNDAVEAAADAMASVEEGHSVGKTVLKVA